MTADADGTRAASRTFKTFPRFNLGTSAKRLDLPIEDVNAQTNDSAVIEDSGTTLASGHAGSIREDSQTHSFSDMERALAHLQNAAILHYERSKRGDRERALAHYQDAIRIAETQLAAGGLDAATTERTRTALRDAKANLTKLR